MLDDVENDNSQKIKKKEQQMTLLHHAQFLHAMSQWSIIEPNPTFCVTETSIVLYLLQYLLEHDDDQDLSLIHI